ncbi:uncharacterized protein LOC103718243 isoform X2 [Phoenix dactylifera]|uniref:YTH domain-containing family protein n=1 Tax=Phoenix dactylifera TaxID=42345 RepID=A0A8B8ZGB1_PHODC|nr:uncharacterized protein LOC103718243 isoform X2 [Phoenix dactylifera]
MKENTSVIDSSLTESKHDLENSDDQESSFDKDNEEYNASTRGERFHSFSGVDSSSLMHNEKNTTRYFIIKSLSHQNIQLSIEKGIWATQVMNEPILEEAYHNSDRVILIFSVNMSGFFQGYAQMMSSVGWKRDKIWSKSSGGNNPWGHTFKVKWLRLHNLPFQKTLHLKNPLNDYKPVKISRDCQELSKDVGEDLCGLFDEVDIKCKLKRPCRNFPLHLQDEDCMLSIPSSNLGCSGATVLDPPFYQHVVQHGECSGFLKPERSHRISFLQNSPSHLESQKISKMKQPRVDRGLDNRQTDKDITDERNLPGSFSEDDILNMTYEEYLQAVGRSSVSSPCVAAVGPPWTMQGVQASGVPDNDLYNRYLSDWYHCQKVNGDIYN